MSNQLEIAIQIQNRPDILEQVRQYVPRVLVVYFMPAQISPHYIFILGIKDVFLRVNLKVELKFSMYELDQLCTTHTGMQRYVIEKLINFCFENSKIATRGWYKYKHTQGD